MKTRFLLLHGLGTLAVAVLLFFGGLYAGPGESIERFGESLLYRLTGSRGADPRIVLVAIDDESIGRLGPFPWRRDVYARLIDGLSELGARTIALDVMFLDPSSDPAADKRLAEATRRSGRVIHAMTMAPGDEGKGAKLLHPLPEIAKGAAGVGSVALPFVDGDGIIRVMPSNLSMAGHPEVFSQAVVAAAHFLRLDPRQFAASLPPVVPLSYRGAWDRGTFRMIPVHRLLDGKLSPEERGALREAMVFLGSTSLEAFDHRPSPFGWLMPGVFASLTLADNILNDRPLKASFPGFFLIAVPVVLLLMWFAFLPPKLHVAGAACVALACFGVTWLAFRADLWLWPSGTLAALLTALVWSGVCRRYVLLERS